MGYFVKSKSGNQLAVPIVTDDTKLQDPLLATMVYNTTTPGDEFIEYWDGTEYVRIGEALVPGPTNIVYETITPGVSNTGTFPMSFVATTTSVIVSINGLIQEPLVSYTVDGLLQTITFIDSIILLPSDIITVRYFAN